MYSTRKELAHVFRSAMKHLNTTHDETENKTEYICWAINKARIAMVISKEAADDAKEMISSRIRGYSTFDNWMQAKHPELRAAITEDWRYNKSRKMQQTRRAWLKSLAEEFSK